MIDNVKKSISKLGSYFSLIALCVSVTGCFPYHFTTRRGLTGIVVDAETQAPVTGAHILSGTNETALAISATDGSFAVPAQKQWLIYFVGEDFFATRWMTPPVSIQHAGYETNQIETFFVDTNQCIHPKTTLGVIPLKPLAQTH